jgi:hypothetical protein
MPEAKFSSVPVMTCPLVRPYSCAIYSLSSCLLLPSRSLSHSLTLSLPVVSTIFLLRIYLCVHDLSFASRLYMLVVFCLLCVILSCCLDEWTYRSEARDPHSANQKFSKRSLYILNPILWFLTCSPENFQSNKRKKTFPHDW